MHRGTRKPGYVRAGCNRTDRAGVYFGGTRIHKINYIVRLRKGAKCVNNLPVLPSRNIAMLRVSLDRYDSSCKTRQIIYLDLNIYK